MPTEAEWEYAAREGGKNIRFGNGKNTADPSEMNFNASESNKKPYSVVGEYRDKTVAVNSFSPNALGLYNMSGNVWEWCSSVVKKSDGVIRGGSCLNSPQQCRTTHRPDNTPTDWFGFWGFRVAFSLQ